MAILNNIPKPPTVEQPIKKAEQVVINEPKYKSTVVDSNYQSLRSLITHIEGSSWVVKYYQQILTINEELTPLQLDKDPVYQQYTEISDLELKVSTPLSSSQDSDTGIYEIVGTATIYPPLIPNYGDMFIADIGDGRSGIFSVTSSRRLSILTEPCFEVEYVFISIMKQMYEDDLERKTIKKVNFVKKLIEHGENPLLVTSDYNDYLKINEVRRDLIGSYFGNFFNKKISSLAVPDQKRLTFDPWLVKAITSTIDIDEFPLLRNIKNYSVELPDVTKPKTIWDALIQNRSEDIPLCSEKLALVESYFFGIIPQYEGIYFTNVQTVVYPIDKSEKPLNFSAMAPGKFKSSDIRHQFENTILGSLSQLSKPTGEGIESLYPIHPVTKDDYYVFSEAFYFHQYEQQSQLETLVRDMLTRKPVNRKVLLKLCENSYHWTSLDRFYYTPILLILLKLATRF